MLQIHICTEINILFKVTFSGHLQPQCFSPSFAVVECRFIYTIDKILSFYMISNGQLQSCLVRLLTVFFNLRLSSWFSLHFFSPVWDFYLPQTAEVLVLRQLFYLYFWVFPPVMYLLECIKLLVEKGGNVSLKILKYFFFLF